MTCFVHIRAEKFPKPSMEEMSFLGYQMYGKELADFLQMSFSIRGYNAKQLPLEDDDSWWVELESTPCSMGLRIYDIPLEESEVSEYICTYEVEKNKCWSWKRFKMIDTEPWKENIEAHLLDILAQEQGIEVVCIAPGMHELLMQQNVQQL